MSRESSKDADKARGLLFLRNYVQVIQRAQNCLDQKLLIPSLILIYTLMDPFAWASSDKTPGVRKHFEVLICLT